MSVVVAVIVDEEEVVAGRHDLRTLILPLMHNETNQESYLDLQTLIFDAVDWEKSQSLQPCTQDNI